MSDTLGQCCKREKWDDVRRLIEEGCNVDEPFSNAQYVPLHYVAKHGLVDIAGMLIERGCNVNAIAKDMSTPLHLSVKYHRKDMSLLLVSSGADILALNQDDETPFFEAPWHSMVFPCLVAPAHAKIAASIQASVDLQSSNLSLRHQVTSLQRRIAEWQARAFDTRTRLLDSVKHREAIEEHIVELNQTICVTEGHIATHDAALAALRLDQATCESLVVETAQATIDKQEEYHARCNELVAVKRDVALVDAELSVVRTHIQDKCETVACIAKLVANERLHEHSSRALRILCRDADMRRKLVQNDLIPTLLVGLDRYPKHVTIQMDGVATLCHMIAATGTFPAVHMQRMVYTVSSALVVLRSAVAVDYATDTTLAALDAFVQFAVDAAVGTSSLSATLNLIRAM
ncbi:Aste57867_21295 [Aphanomyces stellatus]|uniref:Aste57867_21295 protein n=1 Tax=Aphanomyces stellatus TaxID=120398 RepID=A0A485LLR7_9STRA|nr:hypothetical protein As57867_021226 [Aphanomyces stellatus]VFT97967.1 Aste57867_21295 [Aphanomyces stellatus]